MLTKESIDDLIEDIDKEDLVHILDDSLDWLISTFGDNSIITNNTNYILKYSPLKPYTTKKHLKVGWGYNPNKLNWFYYGQWAQYTCENNEIVVHCIKNKTLRFTLECFFHEFRHSQQCMREYFNFKGSYVNHPLEHDANNFCYEYVPIFWEHFTKQ
jgi:hypothetical protein